MNIVLAKQTNVIGIVISVERAFVSPKIANATVNAEKNNFRFFIQSHSFDKFLFVVLIIAQQLLFYKGMRLTIKKIYFFRSLTSLKIGLMYGNIQFLGNSPVQNRVVLKKTILVHWEHNPKNRLKNAENP